MALVYHLCPVNTDGNFLPQVKANILSKLINQVLKQFFLITHQHAIQVQFVRILRSPSNATAKIFIVMCECCYCRLTLAKWPSRIVRLVHGTGNPMGNAPWDGTGINCYGMGQINYVPWTTLGLSMGMSFLWESHGKRPWGWDGTGINCYGMGMGQINMSHGQPCE